MKKLIFVIAILFALGIFGAFKVCEYAMAQEHKNSAPAHQRTSHQKKDIYYCPMHPTYVSDKPGDCPICNMKLVKSEEGEEKPIAKTEDGPSGYTTVKINPERQQTVGIKTENVKRERLAKVIRTVGRVAYHPELVIAQEEYLQAKATFDKARQSPIKESAQYAETLVNASRNKLRLLGMSDAQIEELEAKGAPQKELYLPEPNGDVWIYATLYEYEMGLVRIGDAVGVEVQGVADEKFEGTISAIEPVLDAMTRSVNVRAKVQNRDGKLKPQMFANVEIAVELGENLTIPEDAILDSGTRKIAFVDIGDGYFAPREVKTGASAEGRYVVLDGLKEGEPVVVRGNFLIDSESKLKAALAGMGAAGEHRH